MVRLRPRLVSHILQLTATILLLTAGVVADIPWAFLVGVAGMSLMPIAIGIVRRLAQVRNQPADQARVASSAARLHLFAEAMPTVVWTATPGGDLDYANQRWYEYTGLAPGQNRAWDWVEALHPDDRQRCVDRWMAAIRTGEPYDIEHRWRRHDGVYRWHLGRALPVCDATGQILYWVGTGTDIDDQKRMAATLAEREALYRLITEHTADVVALINAEGRYMYLSPSTRMVLGYDPALLVGAPVDSFIHPDDQVRMREALVTVDNLPITITIRAHHADGSWRAFEATGTLVLWRSEPHVLVTGRDITDRKNLEAQLIQSQKLEGVGRLAGGIAHDFNNILAAIMGYAELVESVLPEDSDAAPDVVEIRSAARRAAMLTRQLLAFARKQVMAPKVLSLNDLVLDLDNLLRRLIGEDVELVTLPAAQLYRTRVDAGQIEQVIINLAVNARDAIPYGGKLTIETANVVTSDVPVLATLDAAQTTDHWVMLTVSDTGTGMPPDVVTRAFDPFFTTKPVGEGSGLGLAMVYGIVQQHSGVVQLASAIGRGTTVTIYLPATTDPFDVMPREEPFAPYALQSSAAVTVLLVEDEPSVRAMAARTLCQHGYIVLTAENGTDAIHVAAQHVGRIDLLLADVVMPQMGGKALAAQLAATRPGLKVLFMSGYPGSAVVHQGQLDPGVRYIPKPFTAGMLVQSVREALELEVPCESTDA